MRLLQLNIWQGKVIRQVLPLVKQLNPDFICLQEVFSCNTDIARPNDMFDTFNSLQRVQAVHDYPETFLSPIFSATVEGVEVSYGIAILSKFSLQDKQVFFTEGAYEPHVTATTSTNGTNTLQMARIQLPQGTFFLANHHGHWLQGRFGDQVSVEKMDLVSQQLRKLDGPIVFAGDLNVIAESPAMRTFDGFLEDLTATHHIPSTLSTLGKVNDVACDHILIGPEVKVQKFYVSDELVSDHKAVVLDFEI